MSTKNFPSFWRRGGEAERSRGGWFNYLERALFTYLNTQLVVADYTNYVSVVSKSLWFEDKLVLGELEYLKNQTRKVLNKRNESTGNTNQPPRPQTNFSVQWLYLHCGHPSFKRRGNLFHYFLQYAMLRLTAMPPANTFRQLAERGSEFMK